MDFFKKVLDVIKSMIPVLVPIAAAIPGINIPTSAVIGAAALPDLIQEAEDIFGAGTGTVKKAYVMGNAAKNILKTVDAASTGGQKAFLDCIMPTIDPLIDSMVGTAKAVIGDVGQTAQAT